jgi:hypothetical protein
MGTQGSFLGIKQLECEVDHSTSSGAEVKNERSHTSTPSYAFVVYTATLNIGMKS